ncbi:hypothetical protein T459_35118 [Capsicum annuum]|uniref:glucomannan 4-beta-mannosyltransferase n=1 Tax=Capsicum annuum TaxID=4072 RepID=A0A2G2XU81_CAPAN|nr:hypothetical protein T459_35118 [Capsicum annuum]
MKHNYVKMCDFVAIFDADFQPESDFLLRTVPFLVHNPEIGLVQARWKFVNSDECLLTRMQEMSLDYHFKVGQEVGSATHAFFGFNGTAGVWRISALNEAGGWKDRTIVEDMDLAVRAGLKGWKFVYVGDLKVKNELPSTFKAYRYQQHRWSCGPANLFKKMAMEIAANKKVSMWRKLYLIYSFFFVRKIISHIGTFIFYCIVMPATVLIPEVQVPIWGAVYIPSTITLLNVVGTPSECEFSREGEAEEEWIRVWGFADEVDFWIGGCFRVGVRVFLDGFWRHRFLMEMIKNLSEKSWGLKDLEERLIFLKMELDGLINGGEIASCNPLHSTWTINQDGLLLNSRCTLYKSNSEELSIWGWPLQTAGLLTAGFSARTYTILSGRLTEWSNGGIGYSIGKANSSWTQQKWSASPVQLDPNTWILEYSRSPLTENGKLVSAVLEFLKFRLRREVQRLKQEFWLSFSFTSQYSDFTGERLQIPT